MAFQAPQRVVKSAGKRILFGHILDSAINRNFEQALRFFMELWPGVWGKEIEYDLSPGDNQIVPPFPRPRGRTVTLTKSASVVYDKGLSADGKFWILNASESVTQRAIFY